METTIKYGANEVGCYVSGHSGVHGAREVIDLAVDAGFIISSPEDYAAVLRYDNNDMDYDGSDSNEAEITNDLLDEAERWLNDNAVEEGFSFGWSDGEFFLAPNHDAEIGWCQSEGSECDEGCA